MTRNKRRAECLRDPGGFCAIPWVVLDSEGYKGLSMHARGLLMEVARQFVRDNNGRMLLSTAYLKGRGWHSAGVIQRAKTELLQAGFIYETCKGQRPNRASWYGLTWMPLDRHPGFDHGAFEAFPRSAYRLTAAKPKRPAPACTKPKKNAALIPSHGVEKASIAPSHGIEPLSVVPPHGAMRATSDHLSIPPERNHLDMPSAVRAAA